MWSIQNAPRGQTTWQNAAKESPRGPTTYFHIHPLFGCKTSNSYIPRYSRIHPHASTPTDSAPSNQGNEEKGKQIKKKSIANPILCIVPFGFFFFNIIILFYYYQSSSKKLTRRLTRHQQNPSWHFHPFMFHHVDVLSVDE